MSKRDQLDELMRSLRTELESLPDDGQDHEIRVSVGPNNSGNVAGGNQYIVKLGQDEPNDPSVSRQCPQCSRLTWLHTRTCMHCAVDLFAHDAAVRREETKKRLAMFAVALLLVGVVSIALSRVLPSPMSTWAGVIGTVGLLLAAGATLQR